MSKKYFRQECPDVMIGDTVKIGGAELLVESISEGGFGMVIKCKGGSEWDFSAADEVQTLAREGDNEDYCRASTA